MLGSYKNAKCSRGDLTRDEGRGGVEEGERVRDCEESELEEGRESRIRGRHDKYESHFASCLAGSEEAIGGKEPLWVSFSRGSKYSL